MDTQTANPILVFALAPMVSAADAEAAQPAAHIPPAPAPASALPTLDELLNSLLNERVQQLMTAREAAAAKVAEADMAYETAVGSIQAARATRAQAIESARSAVDSASAQLTETVQKIDRINLLAAGVESVDIVRLEAATRTAQDKARAALEAARTRLAELTAAEAVARTVEDAELCQAEARREAAIEAVVEAYAEAEADEFFDVLEELDRRALAAAAEAAERARREAERRTKADALIAKTRRATCQSEFEAILDKARTDKVLHRIEKHVARRQRELEAALTTAVRFASTLPLLPPTGNVLALAAPGRVDVFVGGGDKWRLWKSWENTGGWGECDLPRNKRTFRRGEIYRFAALKGGKVIVLAKSEKPAATDASETAAATA